MDKKIPEMSDDIKPLFMDQRILMWLCVLPASENTGKLKRFTKIVLVSALIATDLTILAASSLYAVKFVSIDLKEFSIALDSIISAIPMGNTIAMAYLYRHKIPSIFKSLSAIYDKCDYLHGKD